MEGTEPEMLKMLHPSNPVSVTQRPPVPEESKQNVPSWSEPLLQ